MEGVTGDEDVAGDPLPAHRRLADPGRLDPPDRVEVEIPGRDQPVAARVGGAGGERVDDRAGEDRGDRLAADRPGPFLKRVLDRVGGGQDHDALGLELVLAGRRTDRRAGGQAGRERSAVAAVDQHQQLAGVAVGEDLMHRRGGDGGGLEVVGVGVGGGEVEPAAVLDAVAGEMDQPEAVGPQAAEILLDDVPQGGDRLVDRQHRPGEATDRAVVQRGSEPFGIRPGSRQGGESGIVVGVGDHEQGRAILLPGEPPLVAHRAHPRPWWRFF